jgi:hypothetical protein
MNCFVAIWILDAIPTRRVSGQGAVSNIRIIKKSIRQLWLFLQGIFKYSESDGSRIANHSILFVG